MAIKSIFKLLVIIILIMTILNCSYADTGPYVGENQAKTVVQNYLNSHNLPYKVTAATEMYELNDPKTEHKKWISSSQLDIMRTKNETFEGNPVDNYVGSGMNIAWKVYIANSQGKEIGNIWINVYGNGEIIKINLPNNQNTQNNANSTNSTDITNTTTPVSQGSSSNNIGIIFGMIILTIAIGAGYWKFNGR